jgi:hypothetical protein
MIVNSIFHGLKPWSDFYPSMPCLFDKEVLEHNSTRIQARVSRTTVPHHCIFRTTCGATSSACMEVLFPVVYLQHPVVRGGVAFQEQTNVQGTVIFYQRPLAMRNMKCPQG